MKNFKARCWVEKRHKMYDIFEIMIREDGISCLIKNDGEISEEEWNDEFRWCWIVGIEPLLCTGLYDKTGETEGYESDVVRVRWTADLGITEMDFDEIGVIKYNTDSASFRIELVKPVDVGVCECGIYREEWLPLLKCEEDMHYDWEIIGNAYQNRELLNC